MYLHFNRLIPIYDVSAKCKRFNVNYVNVAFFGAYVEPFTCHGKMQVCYSVGHINKGDNEMR